MCACGRMCVCLMWGALREKGALSGTVRGGKRTSTSSLKLRANLSKLNASHRIDICFASTCECMRAKVPAGQRIASQTAQPC
jgi:hypothetical protein